MKFISAKIYKRIVKLSMPRSVAGRTRPHHLNPCQLANVTTLEFSTARIIPAEEGSTKSSVEKHELGTTSRSNRTHLETCYNSNLVRKSFIIKFPGRRG